MVYIDLSSRSKYKVVLRKSSISSAKIAETVQRKWLGRGGKRAGGTLSPLSHFNLRSKKIEITKKERESSLTLQTNYLISLRTKVVHHCSTIKVLIS